MEALYEPERRFKAPDANTARGIILTGWPGMTSAERWETETPWLQGEIRRVFPDTGSYLDYGCGIGRATQGLGGHWIGVDSSEEMLRLASAQPDIDSFRVWMTPDGFTFFKRGLRGAIAIYSLQHMLDLDEALATIYKSLKSGAKFLVLNAHNRLLPDKNGGWWDDGLDVAAEIVKAGFKPVEDVSLEHLPVVRDHHFCRVYVKPGGTA